MVEQPAAHSSVQRIAARIAPLALGGTAAAVALTGCAPAEQVKPTPPLPDHNLALNPDQGQDMISAEYNVGADNPIKIGGFSFENYQGKSIELKDDNQIVSTYSKLAITDVPTTPFVLKPIDQRTVEIVTTNGNHQETTLTEARRTKDDPPGTRPAGRSDLYLKVVKSANPSTKTKDGANGEKASQPAVDTKAKTEAETAAASSDLIISVPDGMPYAENTVQGITDGKTFVVDGFRFQVEKGAVYLIGAHTSGKYNIFPVAASGFYISTSKGDLTVSGGIQTRDDGSQINEILIQKAAAPKSSTTP
ncbi:hypothetical protein M1523_03820 [Patescibacteria group bacterium]|nr:hypothetical protein [Patescibacteria group bacterium]MCL5091821.1 hypothetical protein [Patescibacteria group bacterium]